MGPVLIAAALVALLMPAASADVCFGPGCGTTSGGGGGGSGTSPFNHLSISDGGPTASTQPVNEDNTCFFTIHRSSPRGHNTSVHWHTKDGTATSQPEGPPGSLEGGQTAMSDYNAASGVATFNSEQPRNITIQVQTNVDGPNQAPSEYFFVVISNPQNGVIVDHKGTCVISQAS